MLRDAHKSVARAQVKATAKTWAKRTALWGLGIVVAVLALGQSLIMYDNYRSPEVVERIHARAVTMDMVEGKNLPPMPPEAERDATVAGVDSNNNGVRDDVEIAIHERHPDSPKIRAAQLQYAMALQSRIVEVFSGSTLVAASDELARAYFCIDKVELETTSALADKHFTEWTEEEMNVENKRHSLHVDKVMVYVNEVRDLVLNTPERKEVAESRRYERNARPDEDLRKKEDCDLVI